MKQRPILFSTPMVQAILAGRKTQTRRTKGLEKLNDYYFQSLVHHATGKFTFVKNGNYNPTADDVVEVICPYGQVGDVLWVRETWFKHEGEYFYKADYTTEQFRSKPSIHMPKNAARIWLRITNVRVERLQDISEQDAKAEGIDEFTKDGVGFKYGIDGWHWSCNTGKPFMCKNRSIAFKSLWHSINGEQSWNDNPWVWVIEFEQIAKPQ